MLVVTNCYMNHCIKLLCLKNKFTVNYSIYTKPAKSKFSDTILKSNGHKSQNTYISVQDYYAGKSVFITGGTGFLGKTLLEKLLSTCTKLDKIYLLIREKDSKSINQRLEYDIFKNPLFERLNQDMPKSLKKVVPIAGDVTKPNLAIKTDDTQDLIKKVSVVFHAAASIKFNEPWDLSLKNNFESTATILKLCKQMDILENFVHVSTAYAFTKVTGDNVVEEKIYPAPAEVERVYSFVRNYKHDEQRSKEFLGGLANTYTYAKALSETYIAEHHGNIPTCIVRPSGVGPKIDEPQIGWIDNWFGVTGILFNAATGLNRVTPGIGDNIADIIPVDYVANTCIVAAAKHDRSNIVRVYNSCSSEVNPVTCREVFKFFSEDTVKHGWNIMPLPFVLFTRTKVWTEIWTFLLQLVPAYMADLYLTIMGKKPKHVKIQNRVILLRNTLKFFTLNTWIMKSGNVRQLYSSLSERDRRLFPFDSAQIDWRKYFHSYSQGVQRYLLSKKAK